MRDAAFLYIHAITPVHAGSGTALGHVDLPIQRERHTQWPIVPGSSLKGILRQDLKGPLEPDLILDLFGPERDGDARDHAGALSVSDARILAFPVRSLVGVFAWATCPAVLERFARDAALVGLQPPEDGSDYAGLRPGEAYAPAESPLRVDRDHLLLEDLEFAVRGPTGPLPAWLAEAVTSDPATRARLARHLVVLSDDDFSHFARNATEVTARIGLDAETKTVAGGALFYEEFLPSESLLYALVRAARSRRPDGVLDGGTLLTRVAGALPKVLQIGADETIGKGFCAVRLALAGEGR